VGVSAVHRHVGREPSGRRFNELTLNDFGRPHNPMLNAGAIMCGTLIDPGGAPDTRQEAIARAWNALTGGAAAGFDAEVYESECAHADRNFALAYFMREQDAFPPGTDVREALDFYFRACSMTLDTRALAVAAATFANRGCCPVSNARVMDPEVARNVLSIMYTCGMYNLAGEFAFSVGLPAKSGVSGGLVLVVPGVAGFAVWSPRLDRVGNTARGVGFARALTERFPFHHFETGPRGLPDALDRAETLRTFTLLTAAQRGDVGEIRRLFARGVDLNADDYDGRTALHAAAMAGRTGVIDYLLAKGADRHARDGDGLTPLDRARAAGHADAADRLDGG
jgi:glutaminase